MKRICCVALLMVSLVGCGLFREGQATLEEQKSGAVLSGYMAVWAAVRFGHVNNLELKAILPIVQDARKVLSSEPEERPMVLAELLQARLLSIPGMDPLDVQFIQLALANLFTGFEREGVDANSEQAAVVLESFLRGVEAAIVAQTTAPEG